VTKVLIDTNVILDVVFERNPHAWSSTAMLQAIEKRAATGFVAAHAVTTIHYLIRRSLGLAKADESIAGILRLFEVATIDDAVIRHARELAFPDFEDAVTAAAANRANCDYIVTRNAKDFHKSPVRVLTPEAMLPILAKS
jgi:predicted nucleic acid-binding protein